MSGMDRFYKRKKEKQNTTATTSITSSSGGMDRYYKEQYYRSLDTSGVDEDYINTFISDTNSFFGGVNENSIGYDTAKNTLGDLITRFDTIQGWLYKNRSNINQEAYNSVASTFDGIKRNFDDLNNYYSQWEDEDDYNTAVRYNGYGQKYSQMTGQEIMAALGKLEDGEERDWLNANLYNVLKTTDGFDAIANAGWKAYTDEQKRKEKEAQQAAAQYQEKPWYEKLWDAVQQGVLASSQTSDTSVINTAAIAEAHRANDAMLRKPADNWTEDHKLMYGYLRKEVGEASAYEYAFYVNNVLNSEEEQKKVQQIKDWSTKNFGTGALATAGSIIAAPYGLADFINDSIGYRTLGYAPGADGFITPFEYSEAATGGIAEHFNGVDEFGVAQNVLPENIPVIGGKGWGDVYQLGVSTAQSAAYGKLGGLAGKAGAKAMALVSFFGPGAASAWDDAVNRGASAEQAFLYGISMGAADAIGESIGIDNLMKIGSSATAKEFFWNLLKQSGAEGIEEGVTNVFGNIADQVLMGDKSNFYFRAAEYQSNGMNEKDAKRKAWREMWEDAAYDTLGGFASGIVHAGPETVIKTYKQNRSAKNTYGGSQQELVAEALEIAPDNAFAKEMQGKLNKGKNLSGGQLNRLVQQNEAALAAQDMSSIQNATESRLTELGETGDVRAIAAALAKQAQYQSDYNKAVTELVAKGYSESDAMEIASEYVDDPLSQSEKKLIASSKYGQRVANELNPDNIKSGEYASAWAEGIGTERINAEEYGRILEASLTETSDRTATTVAENDPVTADAEVVSDAAAEENGADEATEDSVEGKTILVSTGGEVQNVKFAAIKDGKATVTLDNGTTASAEDVSFGNENDDLIFHTISRLNNMTVSAANAIWNAYKMGGYDTSDTAATAFGKAAAMLYRAGYQGDATILREGDSRTAAISKEYREIIYQNGRKANAEHTQTQQEKVEAKKKADAKKKTSAKNGGVYYGYEGQSIDERKIDDDHKKLTKAQKVGVDFVKRLAKKFGRTFYFYESYIDDNDNRVYKNHEGKIVPAENGFYDPEDGSIHIDLNAEDGHILFTIAHELVHSIKDGSPKHFKQLADIVMEGFSKGNVPLDKLIADRQAEALEHNRELTEDEAYEEVIAHAMESILSDGKVMDLMRMIEGKDKSLGAKIRQFFQDIAQLIKDTINTYKGVRPESPEGNMILRMKDIYQKLQPVFAEGLYESEENFRTAEKNTATNGGVRYSYGMTPADVQAIQRIGRISINQFSPADIKATERFARQYWKEIGIKSPFFRAWFGDWRANDQTKVRVATQRGDSRGIQKNTDTGWDIQVSGMVFNETKRHTESYNVAAKPYLPYINSIVKNAVLLDSFGIDPKKTKSHNSLLMHSLYAVADTGNGLELIKLYVEEMNDPNKRETSKRAYQLQNVEKYQLQNGSSQKDVSSISSATGSIRTVADLFKVVKQKDSAFKPNPSSKVVNADGTPKVVYHGSLEIFDVFSYGKIGSSSGVSILGDGFYFTDKKKLAQNYGGNVYACYLQTRTPYQATEADAYRIKVKDLQAQDYDCVIMDTPSGTVYMVFDNIQIKSATENIGTFDGSDSNIRYAVRRKVQPTVESMLRKENAELRNDVARLKELLQLQKTVTKGTVFTQTSVRDAANMLKKNNNATGNSQELAALLDEFYKYVAKGEDLTWEGIREKALPAVNWLQEHVKQERSEYSQDVLNSLRGSRVYLDDVQKSEAAYRYGSFNDFRKMLMGSIVISNDANMSLDSLWQEMSSLYPDVFDSEMNAADMPEALADIVDRLRNEDTSFMEYQYNWDMIAQDLVRQVYDSYWRVSTVKTYADRMQAKINQIKSEHYQTVSKLKAEYGEKIERLKAEHRAEVKFIREAFKERMEAQQKEITEHYQESRKKAVDSRKRTKMREKIRGVVSELNQLLFKDEKIRHVPDKLKKAVAESLSLVDMDTTGAEQRVEELTKRIAELQKDMTAAERAGDTDRQLVIQAEMDDVQYLLDRNTKINDRLMRLHSAYEEIKNSTDPDIANAYDPVISGCIQELAESIKDTPFKDMSMEQLEDVYGMYRMVLTRVRDANKAFFDSKHETIQEIANEVMKEVRSIGGENVLRAAWQDPIRKFSWNNLKPVYAMERIGSKTLANVFSYVRAGEDTWAVDIEDARKYYLDKAQKYGYDSWNLDKKFTFESASGNQFELSLEQILSLYAYSKRAQAFDHLRLGGFVFDSDIETRKESTGRDGKKRKSLVKYKVNTANAHQLTVETMAKIVDALSEKQRGFVDDMQDYLSTVMGAKGNEITMQMYGVKLFKEKFYFPLKSAKQFLFEQNEVAGEVKIKNSGFTNKVVAHANNPVILRGFMDVWADHVNDMSMYHAFVLPLEDFNRVFNYNSPKTETKAGESVKGTIQNAYSPVAVDYVKQLITDLNGGAIGDPRETLAKAMTAKFKKAKTFTSFSVIIQQPSAIGRAFALVDRKYLRPTKDGMNHKELWSELKKYAPVAVIKEMGYFDTNMGRSARDYIKAKEYSGLQEMAKAFITDSEYRDDRLSKFPALADELTWCAIWNAVKRETAATHRDLRPGSEEFLKAAGERFTEVVTKTQVYDSVLTKSANMRSKSSLMGMLTAFMAEPTTTINMLEDAITKAKRGDSAYAKRAFASVMVSVILNNALVALIYAMRDDDEDETYLEKYAEAFVSGMIDDINPITYYPYLKDLWSLFQGYDVERADVSLFGDLADCAKALVTAYSSDDGDKAGAWWDLTGTMANIFGVPMDNITRDVRGVLNMIGTVSADMNDRSTTFGSMNDAIQAAIKKALPVVGWLPGESASEKLYDAVISGDVEYAERLKASYEDESGYRSAMREAIQKHYEEGDIDENTAAQYLMNHCGMDEYGAESDVQYWAFKKNHPEVYADDQWFDTYVEKVADSGVPVEVYVEYRNTVADITGEGKKKKRMDVIHSLQITNAQKDALYFAEGWAASTLDEAPWH